MPQDTDASASKAQSPRDGRASFGSQVHSLDSSAVFWFDDKMLPSSYDGQDCPLARALEIVGERWTLLVLRDGFYGVRRFNDFLAHLDMPRTVLSNRLRSLVERGLMVKVPDPGHSGRWLYELTDDGMALWPALYALGFWGARQSGWRAMVFTHDACGTALDPTARCAMCGVLPAPSQVLVSPLGEPKPDARTDPVALGLRHKHRLLDFLPADRPADGQAA